MGDEDVTVDDVLAEITEYIIEPDYTADGWRMTSQILEYAQEQGESIAIEALRKRLERNYQRGKLEKLIDSSRRAWWRLAR